MQTNDFGFELPLELIAQEPANPRDSARMLCVDRQAGSLEHKVFENLLDLLEKGDLLVLNNSKVMAARLLGVKENTTTVCEILLLRQQENDIWECLAKPGRKMKVGANIIFGDGSLVAKIEETLDEGRKIVSFKYNTATFYEKLDEFGNMPLPPYIKKQLVDNDEYQTVYAKKIGSAAAPTAGLHFTDALMEKIRNKGVGIAELTLHVGLGTFRPVKVEDIDMHIMHSEYYEIEDGLADAIKRTKAGGGRVFAVGTTSARTLEACATKNGEVRAEKGDTDIFIFPGYKWKVVDGLITNFHLPESTLIMLVSAFCGYENTMNAYKVAVKEKYRFFSFGDAMFIV